MSEIDWIKDHLEQMCVSKDENEIRLLYNQCITKISDIKDHLINQMGKTEDATYVVFYSKNNAAYVALDEKSHRCIPVRNLSKAYCIKADLDSIAKAKNELSKYQLAKLKPIELKFLTQKEYDDTIGRAKNMAQLMALIPQSTNTDVNDKHTVTNFASTKSGKKKQSHIGMEKKDYSNPYQSQTQSNMNCGCDVYHLMDSYYGPSYNTQSPKHANVVNKNRHSLTARMENPAYMYTDVHMDFNCEDPEDDYIMLTQNQYDNISDLNILIPIMLDTIGLIEKSNYDYVLGNCDYDKIIDVDYMLTIDYSRIDDCISNWHNGFTSLVYMEDFDPTIVTFKKNISAACKKYVCDELEMASKAVYNYILCIIAYVREERHEGK